MKADAWAIHFGHGLKTATFDLGRAPVLAAALHGIIKPMIYKATMQLREQLIAFEGWKHNAYPDPLTGGEPWTIGVGHTGPEVHEGLVWTDEQIGTALAEDIESCVQSCIKHFPWFEGLNEARQAVIVGMCFQIGINGLLKFVNTLKHVADGDYAAAADGMEASLWAQQTPKRAKVLAGQMESGNFA